MALVLRNAALQKNVSLLKCIKTRTVVTTANKNNNQAPLSTAVRSSLTEMDGWTRPVESGMMQASGESVRRRTSWPKQTSSEQLPLTILSPRFFAPMNLSIQKRNYTCKPSCCSPCCLPPPCNTPPRCLQYMTGYYYYPYGTWFCGPYHDAKVCAISKGACTCAACLAAQGAVANAAAMGSAALTSPMSSCSHAAMYSNQAAQMAHAASRARAQSTQAEANQAEPSEANAQKPETIPVELPSMTQPAEEEKPKPPKSNQPVKPNFSRFYPFP